MSIFSELKDSWDDAWDDFNGPSDDDVEELFSSKRGYKPNKQKQVNHSNNPIEKELRNVIDVLKTQCIHVTVAEREPLYLEDDDDLDDEVFLTQMSVSGVGNLSMAKWESLKDTLLEDLDIDIIESEIEDISSDGNTGLISVYHF